MNLPPALIEAAKDAFWLDRATYLTFSAWVAEAVRRHVEVTKATHGVETVPRRPGDGALPPGRPLS